MKIKNAVLIHGPGRSGTSLLNSMLSLHKEFAWISVYVNTYPNKLWLSYFNRLQGISAFEKLTRGKRKFPRSAESYNFWKHYVPQFNNPDLDCIPKENAAQCINALLKIIFYSGKKRLITKITGNSRHQTLDAVFENLFVIWIDRDPKAVIMSYYKQRWNYKQNPTKFEAMPKKELLLEYFSLYKSFQEKKKDLEKFNLKVFYYEDLIKDKFLFFKEVCHFTELEYTIEFEQLISGWKIIEGTNTSYKKFVSSEEEKYLDDLIASL